MSKTNKYLKAGVGYTIGNYLLKGISFITLPIFVRLMSTSDYGNYNTFVAYESIFNIIMGLALYVSLKNAKYKYNSKKKFDEYVSSCIQIGIVSTIIIIALANIAYPLYASFVDMQRGIFNLLLVEAYSVSLVTMYNCYISLEYKYMSFLLVSFINVIANVALSLVLMFTIFRTDRYLARVYGTAIPVVIIGVFLIIYFVRKGGFKFNKEHWVFALSFSLPLILHGVSQVILNQFDRIMIKTMTGAVNAGIYSFAYNISSLVLVTSTSLQQVWQPWFYERMAEKAYPDIREKGDNFALGMMLFVACVMLGAREIILILGTKEYIDGIYFLLPILAGGYFAFLYNLPAQVEYYYEKTKYIAVGTCIAAGLNIAMNYCGVKMFGPIAAAYTTLIIYGLYFGIHYILAIKVHGSSMFSIRKIGVCSFGLLIVGAIATIFNEQWYIRWGLLVVIGCYFMLWLCKTFGLIKIVKSKIGKGAFK